MAFYWAPFWSLLSIFVKCRLSAFSEKEINVVVCLDRFLCICKMMLKIRIFKQILSKMKIQLFSITLQIIAKNLSKKLRHELFIQRKLRVYTSRIWEREAKREPGESQFFIWMKKKNSWLNWNFNLTNGTWNLQIRCFYHSIKWCLKNFLIRSPLPNIFLYEIMSTISEFL